MLLLLRQMFDGLQELSESHKDVRIDNYPMLGSPMKVLGLTVVYMVFVKRWGPYLMRNRAPFDLKHIMLVYNALQVLCNFALFCVGTYLLVTKPRYKDWGCMSIDRTRHLLDVELSYYYYILKVVDYMDTVFMVLRKNFRQISVLHLYHHVLMVICCYMGTRYMGSGHHFMMGYINTMVHVLMYGYYFVSALRPAQKKNLWWKKYITQIQMAQFAFLLFHFTRPLLRNDCIEPKLLMLFSLVQSVVMLVMFTQFYYKTYFVKISQNNIKKE